MPDNVKTFFGPVGIRNFWNQSVVQLANIPL